MSCNTFHIFWDENDFENLIDNRITIGAFKSIVKTNWIVI